MNGSFLINSPLMWKKKQLIFPQSSKKDDIPIVIPKLNINNNEIARTDSMFLGVLLDENLSWKTHIKYIENKISKNIGNYLKQGHS